MKRRCDADYEIEALSKGWKVLEAIEDGPVREKRIVTRTGFSRNYVMRALKTLQLHGAVVQNEKGEWQYGKNFLRLFPGL